MNDAELCRILKYPTYHGKKKKFKYLGQSTCLLIYVSIQDALG
jgi:hypothetical protein